MATRRPTALSRQISDNSKPAADVREWGTAIAALGLSPQQAAIVDLILRGKTDKEIAVVLDLSIHTVRTYLYRAFARLGVTDRMGVVLAVVANRGASCTNAACPYKQ